MTDPKESRAEQRRSEKKEKKQKEKYRIEKPPHMRMGDSRVKKPKKKTSLFKRLVLIALFLGFLGAFFAWMAFLTITKNLPRISSLSDYRPNVVTTVYSDDGRKIAEFFKERRIVIPLSEMSRNLKDAFVAAEDAKFYQHEGLDYYSIVRAFFRNIRAGAIVQGGSTITQQVARSFFLSPEKTYMRKIKEAVLARRIERTFSKSDILFLYLNQIYLGHGAYGVEAAAENYFGKPAIRLTLAECAMLAGLPRAPSRYSPFRFPKRAEKRRVYVLKRMAEEGYITRDESKEAMEEKIEARARKNLYIEEVPFFTEYARREVEKKYGANALYKEGLNIYTTVSVEAQKAARKAVEKGIRALDKRQGYRGPLSHVSEPDMASFLLEMKESFDKNSLKKGDIVKGVVTAIHDESGVVTVRMGDDSGEIPFSEMKWARKPDPETSRHAAAIKSPREALSEGDVILVRIRGRSGEKWALALEQTPEAESAVLCMEARTGFVKAMVGGRDFRESQFNRAIQSRRQPGSAFKPIIYSAALDKGYTPASMFIDSPVVYHDEERDFTWKPKNYGEKFHGPTLLREALALSRNVVTIKILKDIGIDYVIDYAREMGVKSPISRDLSIALGSSGMSLLEIVNAYSVFPNQGLLVEPVFITRIENRHGETLEETETRSRPVIDESTAYIMTSLLESVVKNGTGHRVKALGRPVAGKTGTTNNLFDAWFVGFTPDYVTGAWVGFDGERPIGHDETGSRAAAPIWLDFMKKILRDKPVKIFSVPEGVVFSKIDAETGLLPIPETRKTIFECFKEGTIPTEYSKKPGAITSVDDFFKSGM
ncbi:Penicillin-binding protein [Candidatus Desulfarcum epimagneticum]|uniref:Penicillin-binding protein 1A n=1 Tax=uncultured Desulfobacteraceae bacterium TaxID=218296 RepID=A0A484HEH7_9BACT|nr:Penicillin-binding protein [uncultured Desulfobacteraceae bacterium]